ncbi:MAG: GntR family transcriptional regulator [Syntrophales bacterium]|nr:GntR family transcriptional regulator [Syntrophales bacterium]
MTAKEKKTMSQKSKMDFQSFVSRIENMILTGRFKPRERLIEAALSEMFGVSRYTVRDAFKVLETKGLVTVTPFRGVVVSELGQQEVEEIFVIRAALEQVALRLSTQNTTTVDIKVLRKMVKKIEDAHHDDDFVAMVAADTNFHDYVFQMSRNKTLRRMINDLRNRCHIIRYSAWSSPSLLQQVMAEHRLIVDAIEARDVAALNELSEKHIRHGKEAYLLRLKAENALLK